MNLAREGTFTWELAGAAFPDELPGERNDLVGQLLGLVRAGLIEFIATQDDEVLGPPLADADELANLLSTAGTWSVASPIHYSFGTTTRGEAWFAGCTRPA